VNQLFTDLEQLYLFLILYKALNDNHNDAGQQEIAYSALVTHMKYTETDFLEETHTG
jgi:hypothetical protein